MCIYVIGLSTPASSLWGLGGGHQIITLSPKPPDPMVALLRNSFNRKGPRYDYMTVLPPFMYMRPENEPPFLSLK
jgi:hypothetical protein